MPNAVLGLVAVVCIVGAVLWGLTQLPLDPTLKTVARVILIVVLVIYAIKVLMGLLGVSIPG